ncbi:tubular mastigoneme protein [Ochromonadaceae sp. CCMP2298]|nr:tubular mastigoneme protein [Ochromonadaceae sp. CCMP2298]
MLQIILIACLAGFASVASECANACNGHGRCTSYDMCICNRNWQAADCSERVCMFGLAHVDTPKGDLDTSGTVSDANILLIDNSPVYPYGTTEQFPQMQDSDLNQLENSAHYYMECSNKGKCDRSTGECECFEGYDGVSCQRASCPGYPSSCSGHGVCKTIKQLATTDYGNVYELWDKDTTMGCECDKGYTGPDCSLRSCKYGVDPLYLDDVSTVKYSIFDFATLTTSTVRTAIPSDGTAMFTNGEAVADTGYWTIRYFDNSGEDWVTDPIAGDASCETVMSALYGLPNDVISPSSLSCTKTSIDNKKEGTFSFAGSSDGSAGTFDVDHPYGSSHPYRIIYQMALWEAKTPNNQGEISSFTATTAFMGSNDTQNTQTISGYIYRMKFHGNPGKIQSPEIELYLDGKRPSLVSPGGKVITKVWTDGQQGEYNDHFADHCDGVTARIGHAKRKVQPGNTVDIEDTSTSFLTGMTTAEKNLLKKCLGSGDFDTSNNIDVYNWDKGSKLYPHVIKLVRSVTTYTDGGYFAVLWYDTRETLDDSGASDGTFKLLNPFRTPDNFVTDNYDIYTTKGTLALTSDQSEATFGFASKYVYMTNITYDLQGFNKTSQFDGDISCEVGNNNAAKLGFIHHCLNKTDMFTLINWEMPEHNPRYINMYTAERLYTGQYQHSVSDRFSTVADIVNTGPVTVAGGRGETGTDTVGSEKVLHYQTHFINTDLATNWAASVGNFEGANVDNTYGKPMFHVYKFFPSVESTYEYVAPCSNRGICNTDSGVCECFAGYTSDSCATQASLAV